MGRKILQGLAKNLCQIFLGWQCYYDLPGIERLGKGKYEIDVLTKSCKKDGMEINSLKISEKLQLWFSNRLKVENISLQEIQSATLLIEVTDIQAESYWVRLRWFWLRPRRYNLTIFFFDCHSHICAFGREYKAQDSGQRELV